MEWIRKHPLETAFGGVVAFIILLIALTALFSGDGDDPLANPPSTDDSNPLSTSPPGSLADGLLAVDLVACAQLLTSDEIDDALGLTDLTGLFLFNQGEVCVHTPDPEGDLFVRTEPGHPDDFEPGATMFGVQGEVVEDVGYAAVWFSGKDSESGADIGALSVGEETTLGWLYFRIVLARPDADDTTRLDAARALALAALPRFPGVVIEPELVEFETEDSDPAVYSYAANVEAKVDRGEWTLGEGLLETLRALAGQTDPADVLVNPDLILQPAVSVVLQASEFVADNPNDPNAEQIDGLLSRAFPSIEGLQDVGAIAAPSARARYTAPRVNYLAQEEPEDPEQQEKQEAYCQDVWGSAAPCLVEVPLPELEADYPGKYQLLVPFVTTEWAASTPLEAKEAMIKSAELYESIATMPEVQVVFTPSPGSMVFPMFPKETQCQIALGTNAGAGDEFQQRLAVTMAYCLIYEAFGDVLAEDGLAWYLGARVYDKVNLEHGWADDLENEELSTSILDRYYTNWALFEFIHPFLGSEKAVFDLAGGLPQSVNDFMHQFYLGLSDANIPDLGGGNIPYSPMAWELDISGPTEVPMVGQPYGVVRMHVNVASGKKACAEYFSSGDVEMSWRRGAPGTPGDWGELPTEIDGESLFVVTSTGSASMDMVVTKVVPDDKECDEDDPSAGSPGGVDPCCTSDHYRDKPPATQED